VLSLPTMTATRSSAMLPITLPEASINSLGECPKIAGNIMFASIDNIAVSIPPLIPKYQLPALTGTNANGAIPHPMRSKDKTNRATYNTYSIATITYGKLFFRGWASLFIVWLCRKNRPLLERPNQILALHTIVSP